MPRAVLPVWILLLAVLFVGACAPRLEEDRLAIAPVRGVDDATAGPIAHALGEGARAFLGTRMHVIPIEGARCDTDPCDGRRAKARRAASLVIAEVHRPSRPVLVLRLVEPATGAVLTEERLDGEDVASLASLAADAAQRLLAKRYGGEGPPRPSRSERELEEQDAQPQADDDASIVADGTPISGDAPASEDGGDATPLDASAGDALAQGTEQNGNGAEPTANVEDAGEDEPADTAAGASANDGTVRRKGEKAKAPATKATRQARTKAKAKPVRPPPDKELRRSAAKMALDGNDALKNAGTLVLTTSTLSWAPTGITVGARPARFKLEDIKDARAGKRPGELLILASWGPRYVFSVDSPRTWAREIDQARARWSGGR